MPYAVQDPDGFPVLGRCVCATETLSIGLLALLVAAVALLGPFGALPTPVRAYNGPAHQALVEEAFRILGEVYSDPDIHAWYAARETRCGGAEYPVICDVPRQGEGEIEPGDDRREAKNTDYYLNLAQVDVATWEDCVFSLQWLLQQVGRAGRRLGKHCGLRYGVQYRRANEDAEWRTLATRGGHDRCVPK